SGGHSYGVTVPGPIGSGLAPRVDARKHAGPPVASSLCGSPTDGCPGQIDLHPELLAWRIEPSPRRPSPRRTRPAAKVRRPRRGLSPRWKRLAAKIGALVLGSTALYRAIGWLARRLVPLLPRALVYSRWNAWGRGRELPEMPRQSFRAQWRRRGKP